MVEKKLSAKMVHACHRQHKYEKEELAKDTVRTEYYARRTPHTKKTCGKLLAPFGDATRERGR